MQTLIDTPPRTRVGVRRSQATTPRVHHRVELVVLVWAIFGALVTSSAPTGTWLFDLLYRGAAVGVLVLAATRARRWTLLVPSGVAAALAASLLAQLAACVALGLAVWSVAQDRRRRVLAASVMGLAAPGLFLMEGDPLSRLLGTSLSEPTGTSLVIGCAAVAPMLRSAWSRLRHRERSSVRKARRLVVRFVVVAIVIAAGSAVLALGPARSAIASTRSTVAAASDGDLDAARPALATAATEWNRAHNRLNGPWMLPVRAIPLVGQQVRAGQTAVRHAAELTAAADAVLAEVDTDEIITDGRVDTALLGVLAPTTTRLADTTAEAHRAFDDAASPWLVRPLGDAFDAATEGLADAAEATDAVAAAVDVGHTLLGSPTGSTIVVMFSTPAEARGSGGFVGNWAEFRATDGRVELVEQYRSKQLNDVLIETGGELRGDDGYAARYGRFEVEHHVQDVTLSPDFPSVGRVTAELYEQATGVRADAVMMIDPFVLAALLGFSGPVEVDGMALSGANAIDELLRGQYVRFAEDDEERTALLDGLAAVVVERLLEEPPDPVPFVQEMLPLARQGRIALWLAGDEGDASDRLGLSGAFPTDGDDVIGVVHQNAAQNKIDPLLERSTSIVTSLDGDAGTVRHDVEVRLENRAPAEGLPPAIIGSNDQGLPLGTNRMLLSVYSPFPMRDARVNGAPVSVETQREFGRLVHTMLLSLPAESEAVLEFSLAGTVDLDDGYAVHLPLQPLSTPDDVAWTVRSASGSLEAPEGWTTEDGAFVLDGPVDSSAQFVFAPG